MINLSIIGYLGEDATIRAIGNGSDVINFSVCATKRWKNKDGDVKEKSFWVEVALWNRPNYIDHLKKGTMVYVSGEPEPRPWASKESGELRASQMLIADEVELLNRPKQQ